MTRQTIHKTLKPIALSALAALGFASAASAQLSRLNDTDAETDIANAPELTFPVDCQIGDTCFVQNFVDMDPSRRWRDPQCRGLSKDGHKGTDIRIPDIPTMNKGVAVFAAADGKMKGFRKGEEDGVAFFGRGEIEAGKSCGNAIIIDHGNDWETQYCHLKQNSLEVYRGKPVKAGDKIGEIGLSGDAMFPHLHFEVRYKGNAVDPYTATLAIDGCGAEEPPLWNIESLSQTLYNASGILNQGFALEEPAARAIEEGAYLDTNPNDNTKSLFAYVRIFGLKLDDVQEITVIAPDGSIAAERIEQNAEQSKKEHVHWIEVPRPADGWQPGEYTASYKLIRYGSTVLQSDWK